MSKWVVTRQTDQTGLANEVSALLPGLAAKGRAKSAAQVAPSRSSFCPTCGGSKGKGAVRCAKCRDDLMRRAAAAARANGHKSLGRRAAATYVPTNAPDAPPLADSLSPTGSRRVIGEGRPVRQPWARHVLVNGLWVRQPVDTEAQDADRDAIARLERAKAA